MIWNARAGSLERRNKGLASPISIFQLAVKPNLEVGGCLNASEKHPIPYIQCSKDSDTDSMQEQDQTPGIRCSEGTGKARYQTGWPAHLPQEPIHLLTLDTSLGPLFKMRIFPHETGWGQMDQSLTPKLTKFRAYLVQQGLGRALHITRILV